MTTFLYSVQQAKSPLIPKDTGDFAFVLLLNSGYTTGIDRIHHVLFFDDFMIEFVADPSNAQDIPGILRIDFQFFSQVADVDHNCSGISA